jgi:hypothetical protein
MKKFVSRFITPTKKDFIFFITLEIICLAVLLLISETTSDYFVVSVFLFFSIFTTITMWKRYRKNQVTADS